jgi:hypothetical protein
VSEHARERLDWQGFLARFHPGSRRHDFDVLAAYESYLNDADHRPADGFPKLGSSSSAIRAARSNSTQRFENEDEAPATADTNRWEGDGGAPAPRPRSAHTDTMVVRGRRRRGAAGLQL